jgi:hypothetical protein
MGKRKWATGNGKRARERGERVGEWENDNQQPTILRVL